MSNERDPIPKDFFEQCRRILNITADRFETNYRNYNTVDGEDRIILFHDSVSDEICARVMETQREHIRTAAIDYFPSTIKWAGYLCFWIRKLKPYYVNPIYSDINLPIKIKIYLNEHCAWFCGISYLMNAEPDISKINIEEKMLKEIVYNLRYHAMSPSAVVSLYQALTNKI